MSAVLLAAGLSLLLGGGFALVHGASQLARQLGVPSFIVGLTVVAFGTSAPELAVNVFAAIEGDAGVSFGNVVGSNLANIGLILGVSGLLVPLTIESVILRREIPMMLLATAAAVVMALDVTLTATDASYDRGDGLLLLLFFSVFLFTATATVLRRREADPLLRQSAETLSVSAKPLQNTALVLAGLGGLAWGADLTVDGAVTMATGMGVPASIVGISVVAVGTSLPELVASVVAAMRGESDLAVGNIVGSNIFNLLFVLGITSLFAPISVPRGGLADLTVLATLSLLLLIFSGTGRRISRYEAGAMLACWLGYGAWRLASAG